MDAKLLFWTAAFADLGAVVACCVMGVRRIRARDVSGHCRMMLTAGALVVCFLLAYLMKVRFVGKEDRSDWTSLDHVVLYTHETCVAAMMLGAGVALYRAWRFRGRLGPGFTLPPESDPLAGRIGHRRAGWVAVAASALAFVTAAGVLAGMYARA